MFYYNIFVSLNKVYLHLIRVGKGVGLCDLEYRICENKTG